MTVKEEKLQQPASHTACMRRMCLRASLFPSNHMYGSTQLHPEAVMVVSYGLVMRYCVFRFDGIWLCQSRIPLADGVFLWSEGRMSLLNTVSPVRSSPTCLFWAVPCQMMLQLLMAAESQVLMELLCKSHKGRKHLKGETFFMYESNTQHGDFPSQPISCSAWLCVFNEV